MDVETVGRLMTNWCSCAWGPLRLELRGAEAQRWTISATWVDGTQAEIEASLGGGAPPLLVLTSAAELSASDLPGVNLNDATQAFAVRAVIERTVATRPWLLETESDVRGGVTLKLRLSLSTEALDPNVFAAGVAELIKVPRAIRWACLQMAGAPAAVEGTAAATGAVPPSQRLKPTAPAKPVEPPPVAPPRPSPRPPESRPAAPPPAAPAPPAAPEVKPEAAPHIRDFCGECGRTCQPGDMYCRFCGAKLQ